MSGNPSQSSAVPRIVGSQEDLRSRDVIDVDFPHVRPFYDKMIGRKVFSKQRPALVIYTKPKQMVVAYISSKIPLIPDSTDVLVMRNHPSFGKTGLKDPSVIRLGVLATVPFEKVLGWFGSIDDVLRTEINTKLTTHIRV
jgi:mRNA interferase MazF